ncbi:hypothetical protein BDK88_0641 [Natrinema hispanicum]|uniref:Uncharacterized protein n=1 Tax=Natrinema hispanicum TaxID=392421 RepID=A0A482YFD9_9EURY|nr:hypothetical protein [Natrinema hispanicum]RZV11760.1 hypothetical protein BDK88_0641 [Natrinema hispanicum]
MKAVITGENDERVGVNLLDNNDIEHGIEMEFDGEIKYHEQDGYPDKFENRSLIDENEPVNQARRYARYYVNRERGYDTINWREDPDRILAAAVAVAELDRETVLEYFGGLYAQVRSHFGDADRPVPLPEGAAPGHVSYQQDIYLGLADDTLASLADLGDELEVSTLPDEPAQSIESLVARLLEAAPADAAVPEPSDLTIDVTSGVHVRWDDASGQYHHERHGQPDLERDPDARFDVKPFAPDGVEDFQFQLVHNLCCQVRDCYIEMGVVPPEPFRIKGLGKHQIATLYEHYDYYQRYHDPSATIDWDALEPAEHRDGQLTDV